MVNLWIPFLVTFLSTFVLRKVAIKFRILDIPNHRKIHSEPVPLLGGLSVFLGICVALGFNPDILREVSLIFIGATLILIVNLIDDIRGLSAHLRLGMELAISLGVILSGMKVSFLPSGFLGDAGEIIITLIWLVGLTNAFNCLDGIDGLAAGLSVISIFYFAFILIGSQQLNLGAFSIILIGSCLGFLPHNFKKAKIFLGDAGSTFLGFSIGGLALIGNWAQDNIVKLAIPILILGVPIFDMVFTTIMRIKEKKIASVIGWFKYTGKDHFHHRLMALGLGPRGALFFIYLISVSFGISAIMVSNEKAVVGVFSVLQALIIFAGIGVLMVVGKIHNSHK